MKKLCFLILFFCSGSSFAAGPLYRHHEPEKQLEFENVYQDIRSISSSSGTYIQNRTTLQPSAVLYIDSGTINSLNVKGSTNVASAGVGFVGEVVSSFTANGGSSVNYPASGGTFSNVLQISLSSGDWLVSGCVNSTANGATVNTVQIAISSFSANTTTDHQVGVNVLQNAGPVNGLTGQATCFPEIEFKAFSPITAYLKDAATYSAATPQVTGARLMGVRFR